MATTLEHFESIRGVKARYFRYLDTKDWPRLRSLFTDDATFDGLWSAASSPDDFIAALQHNLEGVVSVHSGGMPEFQRTDAVTVRAVWSMTDYLRWSAGTRRYLGAGLPEQTGIRGYGHYEDRYSLGRDSTWRISFSRLSRIRIDPLFDSAPEVEYPFVTVGADWLNSRESAG